MPGSSELQGYLRHIRACRNATLPGQRLPFRLGAKQVGWVAPSLAAALREQPEIAENEAGLSLADATALPRINRALADRGLLRWRGEAFDVRATPEIRMASMVIFGTKVDVP